MRFGLLQSIAKGKLVTESPLQRGGNGSTERLHELPNVLRVRAEVGSWVMIEINQVTVVLHCKVAIVSQLGARRTAFYRTKHWLASFREGKVCIYILGKLSKQQPITNAQGHCRQHLHPKRLPMSYASRSCLSLALPLAGLWGIKGIFQPLSSACSRNKVQSK